MPAPTCSAPTSGEIASYYDEQLTTRLHDFVYGNPRLRAAIEFTASRVPTTSRRVLDVGCGIGISSAALSTRFPNLLVHGVDISEKSIEVAKKLFASNRTIFTRSDMSTLPEHAPYDVIVLLDVYEHIPRATWPQFNKLLAAALSPDGVILMAAPTPLTQSYFANHEPDRLQVIDETIQPRDVVALAEDVGGMITTYAMVSAWNTNDYFHLAIERAPQWGTIRRHRRGPWEIVKSVIANRITGLPRRRRLVYSKLGVKL